MTDLLSWILVVTFVSIFLYNAEIVFRCSGSATRNPRCLICRFARAEPSRDMSKPNLPIAKVVRR